MPGRPAAQAARLALENADLRQRLERLQQKQAMYARDVGAWQRSWLASLQALDWADSGCLTVCTSPATGADQHQSLCWPISCVMLHQGPHNKLLHAGVPDAGVAHAPPGVASVWIAASCPSTPAAGQRGSSTGSSSCGAHTRPGRLPAGGAGQLQVVPSCGDLYCPAVCHRCQPAPCAVVSVTQPVRHGQLAAAPAQSRLP